MLSLNFRTVDLALLGVGAMALAFAFLPMGIEGAGEVAVDVVGLASASSNQNKEPSADYFSHEEINHSALLKMSPFVEDRRDYTRIQENATQKNKRRRIHANDIDVLGLYRQSSVWKAQIRIPGDAELRTVQGGDQLSVGTVEKVSAVGVAIELSDGSAVMLHGPLDLQKLQQEFPTETAVRQ